MSTDISVKLTLTAAIQQRHFQGGKVNNSWLCTGRYTRLHQHDTLSEDPKPPSPRVLVMRGANGPCATLYLLLLGLKRQLIHAPCAMETLTWYFVPLFVPMQLFVT